MEYEEFRDRIGDRAGVGADETERAIEATLTTLSERIPDAEAQDLAEQLPHEIGEHLTAADGHESFGYDEFVARVRERTADGDLPDREVAVSHAQAVVAVLLEAVQSTQTDDVLSYLTRDYEPLFDGIDPEEIWGPGWIDRLGERG